MRSSPHRAKHFTLTLPADGGNLGGLDASSFRITTLVARLLQLQSAPARVVLGYAYDSAHDFDSPLNLRRSFGKPFPGWPLRSLRLLYVSHLIIGLKFRQWFWPSNRLWKGVVWSLIFKVFLRILPKLNPKIDGSSNVLVGKCIPQRLESPQIRVRFAPYRWGALGQLGHRCPEVRQQLPLHFDHFVKLPTALAVLKSRQQLGIEAVPCLGSRLVNLSVKLRRNPQCGANVIVLSHDSHLIVRLQNEVDFKMKPIYISSRLHFEAD